MSKLTVSRILVSIVSLVLWSSVKAEAACTGAGLVWNCPAGATETDVQAVLASASDGAVVTFQAGTYTWNDRAFFSQRKGATLICETVGSCTITPTADAVFGMANVLGTTTKFYRISGFVFAGGPKVVLFFYGDYTSGGGTIASLRIDHNTFTGQMSGQTILQFQNVLAYGVVDNNLVINPASVPFVTVIPLEGTAQTGTRGTANNLFFEDNTITIGSMTNPGAGCIDSWNGASWVWRHNTTTNCLVTTHGVTHGWGPVNVELYGNHFTINDASVDPYYWGCTRCFHHQGSGEFLAFDNVFTPYSGHSGSALSMTHYRSASPATSGYPVALGRCDGTSSNDWNRPGMFGYPCKRQPGRDANANLQPMYNWNNRWSDTGGLITMTVENPWSVTKPSVSDHIAANRDYYSAVSASPQTSPTSPFDGGTGMGFGTLANRPATCTTGQEIGGGVGYFATDQGPQGTLYRCSSTNTWTAHYTPYPYPHPLRTAGTAAPATPTNLRVIQ